MKELILIKKLLKEHRGDNWLVHLEDINLHIVFAQVYSSGYSLQVANAITAFIIYAYCYESQWIDIRKDRMDNKRGILTGLGIEPDSSPWKDVLAGDNEMVQHVALGYLETQPDWRWSTIMTCFDYHARMMRFSNESTATKKPVVNKKKFDEDDPGEDDLYEYIPLEDIIDTHQKKGKLIEEAIAKRRRGEELWAEIKREYVSLDAVTEKEFGFKATDKFDIMKWRDFARKNAAEKKQARAAAKAAADKK